MELKGKTKSILVTIFLAVLLAAKLLQSWRGHGAPERERSILFPEVSEVLKKADLGDDWETLCNFDGMSPDRGAKKRW